MSAENDTELLTVAEAAKELGWSGRKLDTMIRRKQFREPFRFTERGIRYYRRWMLRAQIEEAEAKVGSTQNGEIQKRPEPPQIKKSTPRAEPILTNQQFALLRQKVRERARGIHQVSS